jgi:hypothetical protein
MARRVGRNKEGEIFFYDTGGDIIEDLGTLEYLERTHHPRTLRRRHRLTTPRTRWTISLRTFP